MFFDNFTDFYHSFKKNFFQKNKKIPDSMICEYIIFMYKNRRKTLFKNYALKKMFISCILFIDNLCIDKKIKINIKKIIKSKSLFIELNDIKPCKDIMNCLTSIFKYEIKYKNYKIFSLKKLKTPEKIISNRSKDFVKNNNLIILEKLSKSIIKQKKLIFEFDINTMIKINDKVKLINESKNKYRMDIYDESIIEERFEINPTHVFKSDDERLMDIIKKNNDRLLNINTKNKKKRQKIKYFNNLRKQKNNFKNFPAHLCLPLSGCAMISLYDVTKNTYNDINNQIRKSPRVPRQPILISL